MISKTYANKILNTLMGVSKDLEVSSYVYLGLCANEPEAATGALTNAGEPTSVASYKREKVGGSATDAVKFFGSASNGVIKNNQEIQIKTAREDYPAKINYWFLTTSASGGNAYIWGRIKDVLSEKNLISGFIAEGTYNMYTASVTMNTLLGLKEGETYVISWDDVEYDEVAYLYEKDGTSYIGLGNPVVFGGAKDEKKPFAILYNETTTGTETVGNMTVYSLTPEGTHTMAVYGVGIEVKKATVPTFYEYELQASIDV